MEENDRPLLIHLIVFVFQAAFVILAIVFTILTFGIFLPDDEEDKKKKKRPPVHDPYEKLRIELKNKKARLAAVKSRIDELSPIVGKIRRKERRVFFAARLVIISLLLLANWWYLKNYDEFIHSSDWFHGSPKPEVRERMSRLIELITNFNGMILLFYSIPAYLLYGTVGRFTQAMKMKTIHVLKKRHIPTLSELKNLREEEHRLAVEIARLSDRLAVAMV